MRHHKIVVGTSHSSNDGIVAYGMRLDLFTIHLARLVGVDLL
jgi:hypothetical protein